MSCLATAIAIVGSLVGSFYLFKKYMDGRYFKNDSVRLDGKVVIVTGANTGIGKETALEMAKRGASLYLACRDLKRGDDARNEIINLTANTRVFNLQLDLSSQASIRAFVKTFLTKEKRLDILINNAAVLCERSLTVDGYETQFAVNHLGPFLLTNLLLDTLKASAPSRIITVSSLGHRYGKIERDDLMSERSYSAFKTYSTTKLANVLFTRELAKRLAGTKVTANSLHPGAVDTDLARNAEGILAYIFPLFKLFIRTSKSGAQTTITCALDPELEKVSGKYFDNCRIKEESKAAQDDESAEWLWRTSEKLTGLVK